MLGRGPRDTVASELELRVAEALQAEEMRAEKRANWVRLGFAVLGLVGLPGVLDVNTDAANLTYAILGSAWLVHALAVLLYLRLRGQVYVWWLKYLTITLDLVLLSLMSVASYLNHPGLMEFFVGAIPYMFVFWNLVSGLRLSLPAGLYSSLLTAALNGLILGIAVATDAVPTSATAASGQPAINVTDQIVAIVVISLPGVLAGLIGRTARRLLFRAELQSLERGRLEKEKARLGKYLSRELVDMVLEDPERLELGGARQTATIMFTDIRNFTPYSDSHDPEEVVRFLNRYFTRMVSIVFETHGTLDKYIGDGLLAEYGVPFPVGDAPLRAMLAALRMMEELRRFNAELPDREFGDIEIGVGIATGPVLAGNIGSLERMEYTCMGATVSSAARLERLNREMGTCIIICETTFEAIRKVVPAKRLPPMKVSGQSATNLYAVEVPEDVAPLIADLAARLEPPAPTPAP